MAESRRTLKSIVRLAAVGPTALLLAACGGGSDDIASAVAMQDVRLEGCVLDRHGAPAAAATVHARATDGRLLATAHTNADGVYTISVPARSAIMLMTAAGGIDDNFALITGDQSVSLGACMRAADA